MRILDAILDFFLLRSRCGCGAIATEAPWWRQLGPERRVTALSQYGGTMWAKRSWPVCLVRFSMQRPAAMCPGQGRSGEGTESIPEMVFLAAEFHLVLPCSRDLVEAQGQLP